MIAAALLAALALELDDTWQGATPIEQYGFGTLSQAGDPDWWRIRRNHAGTTGQLYVETGVGALCGCAVGDPAIVAMALYDSTGALIQSFVGTAPGVETIPLNWLPPGQPVWMMLTGVPVGPLGFSAYRLTML